MKPPTTYYKEQLLPRKGLLGSFYSIKSSDSESFEDSNDEFDELFRSTCRN